MPGLDPAMTAKKAGRHEFRFHRGTKTVRGLRAPLRAGASRKGFAQARSRSAFPVRRGEEDGRAGPHGHHVAGSRWRPGRHAGRRRHRHRASGIRVSAQRRRGAVRQFRADPHLRRIRQRGAEEALAARSARRPHGDEPWHVGARRRLGGDRSHHQRAARTARTTSSTAPKCFPPSARTPRFF